MQKAKNQNWPNLFKSRDLGALEEAKGATKTNLINPLGAWLDKSNNFQKLNSRC